MQVVASIQITPYCIVTQAVGIIAHLRNRPNDVGWTAVGNTNVRNAASHPAKLIRKLVGRTQRIGIKELITAQAHARKHAVIQRQFDHVHVFGIARQQKHAPVEQHVSDIGAGFVVRTCVGQLKITPERLVGFLYVVGFVRSAVRRNPVKKRPARACDVHFTLGEVIPNQIQRMNQRIFARFGIYIGNACVQVRSPHGVAHGHGLLTKRNAVLIVVGAFGSAFDIDEVFY